VDPLPTAQAAVAVYGPEYFRGERGYRDYVAEEDVFRAEFRRRFASIRAEGGEGRLVDVGCAAGHALVEARSAGFHALGVEPSEEMARVARERSGCEVLCAPVEAASVPTASAGVVCLFDVLEHLVDPVAALRRARAWLAPGGLLAVTVPDFGSWWARASGRRWPFVTPWEHLHYFTRRTLSRALREAGFARPRFRPARVAVSFGTIARRSLGPAGRAAEDALGGLAGRGLALPFGCLFALSRPAPVLPS
jgi:SAM-dependent methyltransferase